jgi:hypothetical protein
MRLAVVVAVLEALVLVGLALVQFEAGRHLPPSLEPLDDPFVSNLRWIEVVLWLAAAPLIGILVARTEGRKLSAAGLAFAGVASAVIASPLLEQLAVAGWTLVESGQTPPFYYFAPPGGWSRGYAIPLLIAIGVVVAGGVAAIEAAVVAGLAHRLHKS